jgi:hypothetical protein
MIEESFKINSYLYTLVEIVEIADHYQLVFDVMYHVCIDMYDSVDADWLDPPTKEYLYIKKIDQQIFYRQGPGGPVGSGWFEYKVNATVPEGPGGPEGPGADTNYLIDYIHKIMI